MTQAMVLDDWDETWGSDAVATIVGLSLDQEYVTADDLRKHMRPPNRSAQYGAAFRSAQAQGLIEAVTSQKSTTKTRNHGRLQVWRRKTKEVQS